MAETNAAELGGLLAALDLLRNGLLSCLSQPPTVSNSIDHRHSSFVWTCGANVLPTIGE